MAKRDRKATGAAGEAAAAGYLKKAGFRIIERNYRTPVGEIDIIAQKGKEIIFVEVKARFSNGFGYPADAVGHVKQHKIIKTALWYMQAEKPREKNLRFDVISVMFDQRGSYSIDHIPYAFDATGMI